jgi:hypothetical protein
MNAESTLRSYQYSAYGNFILTLSTYSEVVIFNSRKCYSKHREFLLSQSLIAASLTLLLLIASIRLTRPIEFSGEIGFVNSLYSSIEFFVFLISSRIFVWISSFCCFFILINFRHKKSPYSQNKGFLKSTLFFDSFFTFFNFDGQFAFLLVKIHSN